MVSHTLVPTLAAGDRPTACRGIPTLSRDGKTVARCPGWNWLKRELDRGVEIPPWHLHDFRRSLVTLCAKHGADVAVLDSLLNHASSVD